MKIRKRFINQTSIIYFLSHIVVFLIGIVLMVSFPTKAIVTSIGASLVAAGIAGWIVYIYILTSKELSDNVKMLTDFGLVKVFPKRSISIREEYDLRVSNAKERIDVIGFGLSAFRQDHLKDFLEWKKKAKFRILLIDPYYPNKEVSYASQRDKEENNRPGTIEDQVKQFVNDTKSIVETGIFEVKLYRCLPMLNVFRIDDEILWGPYLIDEQSRNTTTFLINKNGQLFNTIEGHFERLWNDNVKTFVPEDGYFD